MIRTISKFILFITCLKVVSAIRDEVASKDLWKIQACNVKTGAAEIEFTPLINPAHYTLTVNNSHGYPIDTIRVREMNGSVIWSLWSLEPGEEYSFHLCKTTVKEHEKGYCFGNPSFFRTMPKAPQSIVNITSTETELRISWLPPSIDCTFSHYIVTLEDPWKSKILAYDILGTVFDNLLPGKAYHVNVRTVSEYVTSDPVSIRCSTKPYPPSDMSLMLSTSMTVSKLIVNWTDPDYGDFDRYELYTQIGPLTEEIHLNPDRMYAFDKTVHSKAFCDTIWCTEYRFILFAVANDQRSHPLYQEIIPSNNNFSCIAH